VSLSSSSSSSSCSSSMNPALSTIQRTSIPWVRLDEQNLGLLLQGRPDLSSLDILHSNVDKNMNVYYAVDMTTGRPVKPHMYGFCTKKMVPFRVFWSPKVGNKEVMVSTGDIKSGLDLTRRQKDRTEQSVIREEAFQRGCELSFPTEWLVPLRSTGMHLHSLFKLDTLLDYLVTEVRGKRSKRSEQLRSMAEEEDWMSHIIMSIEYANRWKVVLEAWSEYMSNDIAGPATTVFETTDTQTQALPKEKTSCSSSSSSCSSSSSSSSASS
jgi:hypothetical protein